MAERDVLRAHELAVWRGERCLFEQLHFDLESGQLGLLVGPNGAGKTTLLRVLAGLAPPTQGAVTWNGTAIGELTTAERGQLAYRGHLEALKRDLTVKENLEFHSAIWGGSHVVDRTLSGLRLDAVANARVRHLSAGQRRRVSLATLELSGARLWLLDEPTTNLDSDGRALLRDWLRQHLASGGVAVIATHQPDDYAGSGVLMVEL